MSNTTNRDDGHACYMDDGELPYPPLEFRKGCTVTGQHVIIYDDVKYYKDPCPILELCEVEVYGK